MSTSKYLYISVLLMFVILLVGCGTTAQAASPNAKSSSSTVSITTKSLPVATVMNSYSAQVTASGGVPPYTWSLAQNAKLPSGVKFDTTQGTFSGIPAQSGSFQVGVTVTDTTSKTGSNKSLTLQVSQTLSVTGGALGSATVGSSYSTSLALSGGVAPITWKLTGGSLPAGLSLSSNGTVSGIPTAVGTYSFSATATDASSPAETSSGNYSMSVISALAISTTGLPTGTVGQSYSTALAASGGTAPYNWSIISGALPPGLTLNSSNSTISGTPSQAGTFSFTAQLQDSGVLGQSASQAETITVNSVSSTQCTSKAPVISNVSVSAITTSSATVNWTTDSPADSTVYFGTYALYETSSGVQQSSGVTSHSVTIQGLKPSQSTSGISIPNTIWYMVRSRAACDPSQVSVWEGATPLVDNHFNVATAPTSGNLDFWFKLVGPHHVMQGYEIAIGNDSGYLSGQNNFTFVYKIALSGLPQNVQVSWPDNDIYNAGYSVSSTVVPGDTIFATSPLSHPVAIIHTNVGGVTPPGTYSLTYTVLASASTGDVVHTYTWPLVVDPAAKLASATPATYPPIANLPTWQSRMTKYGAQWCTSTGALYDQKVWFYDGIWAYQRVRDYTGDSASWSPCISNILNDYRNAIAADNYNIGEAYKNFARGLYNDYILNGSAASKTSIVGTVSSNGLGNYVSWFNGAQFPMTGMRETALNVESKRLRDHLNGLPSQVDTKFGVTILLGMADQIIHGDGGASGTDNGVYESFMVGLLAQSLIAYYEDGHSDDARIPIAIKGLADSMYANAWNKYPAQPYGFYYASSRYYSGVGINDISNGNYQPSLNNLVAPMYAWLFKFTGDSTYQLEGDEIFNHSDAADPNFNADGTLGFSANGGKTWTQNYRWSFDFVNWRSGR